MMIRRDSSVGSMRPLHAPDLVISTGAVSAGAFDFVPQALRTRNASVVFHQVALRPRQTTAVRPPA